VILFKLKLKKSIIDKQQHENNDDANAYTLILPEQDVVPLKKAPMALLFIFFFAQFQNIVLLCHRFERNLFEGTTLNIRMI
jgi:hypothetical protein